MTLQDVFHARGIKRLLGCALAITPLILANCAPKPQQETRSPYAPAVQPHPYQQGRYTQPRGNTQTTPNITAKHGSTQPTFSGKEIKIGLLLPLSGKSAELGEAMLDAAMMGLFDKYASSDHGNTRIMLLPKDTKGTAKDAALAAQDAINDGAQLILGPLFSKNVAAVAPVAAKRNINVVSFSNNASVAGNNSFLFGFMPEQQVKRVVQYAHLQGLSRIGAILPDNAYGRLLEESLLESAALEGANIVGVKTYDPEAGDIGKDVQSFARSVTPRNGTPQIDAILLAESGDMLDMLMDRLARFNLGPNKVAYIGTGLWDNESLNTVSGLQGSLFASSALTPYRSFVSRFQMAQGYTPPRIASLGYDSVAFAATLAENGGFSKASLTQPSGYAGPANGIFRLHQDGTIERGLSLLTFDRSAISESVPAPRMFY